MNRPLHSLPRILIINQDTRQSHLIKEAVKMQGFEVIQKSSLKEVQEEKLDLGEYVGIIADYNPLVKHDVHRIEKLAESVKKIGTKSIKCLILTYSTNPLHVINLTLDYHFTSFRINDIHYRNDFDEVIYFLKPLHY